MLKLVIQTNLSLILFLGHCCWRLRSFNSFAQFLDTAGNVVNMYLKCSQIKNYLTIFDRFPFIFGYSIQVVKEVGVKTRKQVLFIDTSCKIWVFPLIPNLLGTKKISCTPMQKDPCYLIWAKYLSLCGVCAGCLEASLARDLLFLQVVQCASVFYQNITDLIFKFHFSPQILCRTGRLQDEAAKEKY